MGDEEAHPHDAVRARGVHGRLPLTTPVPDTGGEWDLGDRARLVAHPSRVTA
jgi:hypothetical protein